jgi:transcriptional regulator with XRE-family HTH domain
MEHIICENIKRLRENAGYNQQSIAEFLHVDQSLISKIEKGERSISADMLEKLASLFGVSVVDLSSKPITKTLSCAFRCSELTTNEMEVISSINRIAINSEFMQKIIEEHNNDR